MKVLTLVAPDRLDENTIDQFAHTVQADEVRALSGCAADIFFARGGEDDRTLVDTANRLGLDAAVQVSADREKKILISDMDSTIIEQECLDELAEKAGIGAEIAAITERAMRGELDFESALTERVARVKGLSASTIDEVLKERITLSDGARTFVRTMRARGALTILVSGGFTHFTQAIADRAGFEQHYGNTLDIEDGYLTGKVTLPILGREAKRERLLAACSEMNLRPDQALAIGDGANDLAMIELAGLGIAYRAKPIVIEQASASIMHTDLTTALYYQGIGREEFAT
ncbi:phosphoserine phosphatase SerB [Parvularcula sp. LCG005]|uniref:phosphoserine phosphatase SerB n=1 Tax=Parvularcula sp. LCG005 TaxID=3078805 RepID=UPI00294213AB|nr:phosphoserine phosphatase SerB [Parvularcula sp. LCG005]WOI54816.1 phosphoserine phosphatase SerB [Parvularcula sp. LCG005]